VEHLSTDKLRGILLRSEPPGEASDALAHVVGCRTCLAEAERLIENLDGTGQKGAGRILQELMALERQEVVERLLADALWANLQGSTVKVQKDRIATSAICKTISFVRLLLEEIRKTSSWEDAERLASLLAASIHAMDPKEFGSAVKNDLRAEALIELANSRRRAAEWRRADDALAKAEAFLASGTGDRRVQARLLSVFSSLESDRGHLESALAKLGRCRRIYEELGARPLVARTLLQAADALSEPAPSQALEFLNEADTYFKPGDPLLPIAKLLRADCLIWIGELREAIRWILSCEAYGGKNADPLPVYRRPPPGCAWLQA
jgi:tetratricopeptide (TPR) repeat protein